MFAMFGRAKARKAYFFVSPRSSLPCKNDAAVAAAEILVDDVVVNPWLVGIADTTAASPAESPIKLKISFDIEALILELRQSGVTVTQENLAGIVLQDLERDGSGALNAYLEIVRRVRGAALNHRPKQPFLIRFLRRLFWWPRHNVNPSAKWVWHRTVGVGLNGSRLNISGLGYSAAAISRQRVGASGHS